MVEIKNQKSKIKNSKLAVITDSELATGFRLAGVEVFSPGDAVEAAQLLKSLFETREYGLVAVSEDYLKDPRPPDRELARLLEKEPLPVVVPFPASRLKIDRAEGEAYLSELVKSCIGYYVKLK
jgi:vacuolar-type H+-ATPase subunit F/Vma7